MQLDMNLERLRSAIDGLLVRLAQNFTTPKLQHLFVLNNYDMALSVLKVHALVCNFSSYVPSIFYETLLCILSFSQEAGDEAKNLQKYFEEKLERNMMAFVVSQCSHVYSIWLCTVIEPCYHTNRLVIALRFILVWVVSGGIWYFCLNFNARLWIPISTGKTATCDS
jgi:hypothetical protein